MQLIELYVYCFGWFENYTSKVTVGLSLSLLNETATLVSFLYFDILLFEINEVIFCLLLAKLFMTI